MLAALALALQKFNIQARRVPGFEEQRPRPRRRPPPGRKLPKRLRNDSDRSRPTSPESGSFYTPCGSLTGTPLHSPPFSPFATPPQSPTLGRRQQPQATHADNNVTNDIQVIPADFTFSKPPQSSHNVITLRKAEPSNVSSDLSYNVASNVPSSIVPTNSIIPVTFVNEESPSIQTQLNKSRQPVEEPVVQAIQLPTVQAVVQPVVQACQAVVHSVVPEVTNVSQSKPPRHAQAKPKVTGQSIPVIEDLIEAEIVERPSLAQSCPFALLSSQHAQNLQHDVPNKIKLKPAEKDLPEIANAYARVQDYFESHPEHRTLSEKELLDKISHANLPQGDPQRAVLDQLAKDHQFLLRRFLEQQDSSDDESVGEQRPAVRHKPRRLRNNKNHRRVDLRHSTTQTDDDAETVQRPLRLPTVEDLVASQRKKATQASPSIVAQPQVYTVVPQPQVPSAPQHVSKKSKAAESYQRLVIELEPLVTPVVAPAVAPAAAATAAAPSSKGQQDSKASLWEDVWGSWGVWLIARFSATGFGGDVNAVSSTNNDQKASLTDSTREVASDIATMPGPSKELTVHLYRDSLSTPWGFRLQGGMDFKQPLTVQRVFVGSPADQNLQRGDMIIRINQQDVTRMPHKQAQDIVKAAGGELAMVVKRIQDSGYNIRTGSPQLVIVPSIPDAGFGGYRSQPLQSATGALGFVPTIPKQPPMQTQATPGFGVDYRRGNFRVDPVPRPPEPKSMLNRLNQSLNQSIWQPPQEDDYEFKPISQMKKTFESVNNDPLLDIQQQYQLEQPQGEQDEEEQFRGVKDRKKVYLRQVKAHEDEMKDKKPLPADAHVRNMSTGKIWSKPAPGSLPGGLNEPGWAPGANKPASAGWSSVRAPGSAGTFAPMARPVPPPVNRPQPINRRPEPAGRYHVPHIEDNGPPAWYGSLRSAGGVRPWEVRSAAETMGQAEMMSPQGHHQPAGHHPPPQASTAMLSPRPAPAGPMSPGARSPGGARSPRGPLSPGVRNDTVVPHSPKVQQMSYGPSGQEYRQLGANEAAEDAQVKHLQYNTPIGLYSRSNVEAALHAQTSGKPGEGTLHVTGTGGPGAKKEFDPSRSEVLALLQAEEHHGRGRPQQMAGNQRGPAPAQSARYEEERPHYQGYVDHSKQSPSMHALEAHVEQEGGGFSDF